MDTSIVSVFDSQLAAAQEYGRQHLTQLAGQVGLMSFESGMKLGLKLYRRLPDSEIAWMDSNPETQDLIDVIYEANSGFSKRTNISLGPQKWAEKCRGIRSEALDHWMVLRRLADVVQTESETTPSKLEISQSTFGRNREVHAFYKSGDASVLVWGGRNAAVVVGGIGGATGSALLVGANMDPKVLTAAVGGGAVLGMGVGEATWEVAVYKCSTLSGLDGWRASRLIESIEKQLHKDPIAQFYCNDRKPGEDFDIILKDPVSHMGKFYARAVLDKLIAEGKASSITSSRHEDPRILLGVLACKRRILQQMWADSGNAEKITKSVKKLAKAQLEREIKECEEAIGKKLVSFFKNKELKDFEILQIIDGTYAVSSSDNELKKWSIHQLRQIVSDLKIIRTGRDVPGGNPPFQPFNKIETAFGKKLEEIEDRE